MKRIFVVFIGFLFICTFGCINSKSGRYENRKIFNYKERSIDLTYLKRVDISLSFIGDIMAHDNNYKRKPYHHIWEGVKEVLGKDDLTFGNLECPVDPEKPMSTFPLFNVHPPYLKAAIDGGVDVFALANNHTCDKGPDGILNTLKVLEDFNKEKSVYFSGVRKNKSETFESIGINIKGWNIGFLSVTQFLNTYNQGGLVNVVNYKDYRTRLKFLKYIAKEAEKYDLFVLSFHGGVEYAREPEQVKMDFFEELFDCGVNIIWAHHPHVLQPWKMKEIDGVNYLALPSTGNFISGQAWWVNPFNPGKRSYTGESAIFQITVGMTGKKVSVKNVDPLLISNYKHPEYGMMVVMSVDDLISGDLPEEWTDYFINRKVILEEITKKRAWESEL